MTDNPSATRKLIYKTGVQACLLFFWAILSSCSLSSPQTNISPLLSEAKDRNPALASAQPATLQTDSLPTEKPPVEKSNISSLSLPNEKSKHPHTNLTYTIWKGHATQAKTDQAPIHYPLQAVLSSDSSYWFYCIKTDSIQCQEEWWFRTSDKSVWTRQDGIARRVPHYRLEQITLGTPFSPWHFWPSWYSWLLPETELKNSGNCGNQIIKPGKSPFRSLKTCPSEKAPGQLEWQLEGRKVSGPLYIDGSRLFWQFSTGSAPSTQWEFDLTLNSHSKTDLFIPPWEFPLAPES